MNTIVLILLAAFTLWTVIALARWIAWKLSRRPMPNGISFREVFAREIFHLGLGITFLILLVAGFLTPVTILAVTAVLFSALNMVWLCVVS